VASDAGGAGGCDACAGLRCVEVFPDRPRLRVYSTCPQSKDYPDGTRYLRAVRNVARWSESAGCAGILVYTDNGICDPWLVAETVIAATERIAPLVAVQPVYMHPYSAAKMVSSLAWMHGRAVALNLLAGGFRNDLLALGDDTPHDLRYERTREYGEILLALLRGETVTHEGRWWTVRNLRLVPPLDPDLFPEVLVSGSSPSGLATAEALGATPVRYPQPPDEESDLRGGVRIGVIARVSAEEAWTVAGERFPADRKGQLLHQLAMRVSDSHWHTQLSQRHHDAPAEIAGRRGPDGAEPSPYWLWPFQNYHTFCPYLVGSYERVGRELARYLEQGASLFILDIPASAEELEHTARAFEYATLPSARTPRE
jgi:alkanesulfonate monooxygenase